MSHAPQPGERLALLLPTLRAGGAERCLLNLANGFLDRGYEVDFVVASAGGQFAGQLPPGVHFLDLGCHRVLAAIPALARYLRTARPRAMLVAQEHAAVAALLARRLTRVPTRISVRSGTNLSLAATRVFSRWRAFTTPRYMHYFFPGADSIIAVSRGVADNMASYARLPRESITVISNPVDLPRIAALAQEPAEHPFLAAGVPVVLSVGRLIPAKEYGVLIRAFARLREGRDARLLILGEGPERAGLEALVAELGLQDTVSLPGHCPNPYAYMSRASLFVLSSSREGSPNALAEALAVGLPVVATDCAYGPREILEDGRWGPLVAVGDVAGLAEQMAATLAAPPSAEFLRQRADDYSLDRIAEEYLAAMLGPSAEAARP